MILVTGAEGLIGRHICVRLRREGIAYRAFDLKHSPAEDIRDSKALAKALVGVRGVVHLAAVSRVIWGEKDPGLCNTTNVVALAQILEMCLAGSRPWFIFASSREVYGSAHHLPVHEDFPLCPSNYYAESKYRGECLTRQAAKNGLVANICRFSNVFGCPLDHPDRVAMAFARSAAHGGRIVVEGSNNMFDFTSVHDVTDGLWQLIKATDEGQLLPPIHFVSGRGTTLGTLAKMAAALAVKRVLIEEAPARSFDVPQFVGNPSRAQSLLGWTASTDLQSEFELLVNLLAKGGGSHTL
jgi:nucleoside-diphosphate-sugar epimerase